MNVMFMHRLNESKLPDSCGGNSRLSGIKGVYRMAANQMSQEEVLSRDELKKKKQELKKKQREEKTSKKSGRSAMKRVRIRLIPIWLRVILVVVLVAISLACGLMVGYGVIGDGNPTDVFNKETWTHIIDLVVKKK